MHVRRKNGDNNLEGSCFSRFPPSITVALFLFEKWDWNLNFSSCCSTWSAIYSWHESTTLLCSNQSRTKDHECCKVVRFLRCLSSFYIDCSLFSFVQFLVFFPFCCFYSIYCYYIKIKLVWSTLWLRLNSTRLSRSFPFFLPIEKMMMPVEVFHLGFLFSLSSNISIELVKLEMWICERVCTMYLESQSESCLDKKRWVEFEVLSLSHSL